VIEAVSRRGLDNFFVPVGVYVLLQVHRTIPATGLIAEVVALTIVIASALIWRRRAVGTRPAFTPRLGTLQEAREPE
jgi:hypothetical protein